MYFLILYLLNFEKTLIKFAILHSNLNNLTFYLYSFFKFFKSY